MEPTLTSFYEHEDEALEGWAVVDWKKGGREVVYLKAVLVAGVWALRCGHPGTDPYPLYQSSTAWTRIQMISEADAQTLQRRRQGQEDQGPATVAARAV